MAILDLDVLKGYIRLCNDGWLQGWHERNGGNLTYRMTDSEVQQCRPFFNTPGEWIPLGITVENLAGEYFLTTGTGKFFQNVILDPEYNIGIAQLNDAGDAYRLVWGLCGGKDLPTSEFPSHLMNHSVKKQQGDYRVIYHAHPKHIIALTFILPLDSKAFTRALWTTMTECPIVFPQGVGVVEWMMPGAIEVAKVTGKLMETHDAVIWAHHGIFCAGEDFDLTFGLMHTIEKSAEIRLLILNSGKPELQTITDDQLLAIEREYHLKLNHSFLCESTAR